MPVHLENLGADHPRPSRVNFKRLMDHANQLEVALGDLQQRVAAQPIPPTISDIQKALSAGGSNPLNLTGLQGTSAATAAVAATIPVGGGSPAPPTPPPTPVPPNPPAPTPPPAPAGGDAIPIGSIAFVNSPNVAAWASTAVISQLTFSTAGESVTFSKQTGANRWPDYIPPSFTGPIQFTLWAIFNIGGQWYGAGGILYWYQTPPNVQLNGGPPSQLTANWFYSGAWSPMNAHQPAVGEMVGFFVTAGDARATVSPQTAVLERSNIVLVPFPADAGAVFNYA